MTQAGLVRVRHEVHALAERQRAARADREEQEYCENLADLVFRCVEGLDGIDPNVERWWKQNEVKP